MAGGSSFWTISATSFGFPCSWFVGSFVDETISRCSPWRAQES